MKVFFTIAASIIFIVGIIPYIHDIHHKRVKPHVLSWLGWTFVTTLGFFAMLSDVFNWGAFVVLANAISCLIVVIYSLVTKTAVFKSSKFDLVFFILGLVGLILWQYFDNPDLAIIFAIFADMTFAIPTIIKTYKEPSSETIFPWSMAALSGLLSLFAISYVSFTEIAYPIYLLVFDSILLSLIIFGLRRQDSKIVEN
jgi:hypothetical protein